MAVVVCICVRVCAYLRIYDWGVGEDGEHALLNVADVKREHAVSW